MPLKAESFFWLVAEGTVREMGSRRRIGHITADLKMEGVGP